MRLGEASRIIFQVSLTSCHTCSLNRITAASDDDAKHLSTVECMHHLSSVTKIFQYTTTYIVQYREKNLTQFSLKLLVSKQNDV